MQCEKCKIKRATVFFTELDRTRHALCSFCASEYKYGDNVSNTCDTREYVPKSYLYELVHSKISTYFSQGESNEDVACPECKRKLTDILLDGRMGCVKCYTSFLDSVQLLRYNNQDYAKYNKKIPRRRKEELEIKERIVKLRALLDEAVHIENFEQAARIRDEIKKLEGLKRGA